MSSLLEPPQVFLGVHENIAGLSEAVRLAYDEHNGRHLVAARDLPAGAVIICEEAYSSVASATLGCTNL